MIRVAKWLISLAIICGIALTWWLYQYANTPLNLQPNQREVTIKPNSSLRSIASQLVKQEVLTQPYGFIVLAKLMGQESSLQSGDYTLAPELTPYTLIFALKDGKAKQASITFIEGHTFKQMLERLRQHDSVKQTLNGQTPNQIMAQIDPEQSHPEGLFFPDTYYFDRDTSDLTVLTRSYQAMQQKLESAWASKASGLPYKDAYEALIMASIVEKETGQAQERPLIAGVFVNRLKKGMLLQTDPTVIYGIGDEFDGNIRKKDLLTDTPYNTYTRAGLTPTPIAMPGLAAIEAALHPAKTKALYFVGKGDGTHQFSETLSAHVNAVRRYQLKKH